VTLYAKDLPYRHSFPVGEAPNTCGCWDCAALSDTPACAPECVFCHHPEARTEWCTDCGADTWHDQGICLSCGLEPDPPRVMFVPDPDAMYWEGHP
jgi:hypothetical protein